MVQLTFSTVVLLPALSLLGVTGVWIASGKNGLFDLMSTVRNEVITTVPGSDVPFRRIYTGVKRIDIAVAEIVFFFIKTVDGSGPGAALQAFHFSGQAGAYSTLIVLEGLRERNKGRIMAYTTVTGLLFQAFGASVIIPLWAALDLFTLPISSASTLAGDLSVSIPDIRTMPYAIILGFIVPTIAMSLPSPTFQSALTQQLWTFLWQFFPLWIYLAHCSLRPLFAHQRNPSSSPSRALNPSKAVIRPVLSNLYLFALLFAVTTHAFVLALSVSAALFPSLFTTFAAAQFHPAHVFVPRFHTKSVYATAWNHDGSGLPITEVTLRLMLWDNCVSAIGALVWAVSLYRAEVSVASGGKGGFDGWMLLGIPLRAVGWSIIGGPAGAAVVFLWLRDQAVFGEEAKEDLNAKDDMKAANGGTA